MTITAPYALGACLEQLRGQMSHSPTPAAVCHVALLQQHLGQAEITELADKSSGVGEAGLQQHVVSLDVTVDHIQEVQVLQAVSHIQQHLQEKTQHQYISKPWIIRRLRANVMAAGFCSKLDAYHFQQHARQVACKSMQCLALGM